MFNRKSLNIFYNNNFLFAAFFFCATFSTNLAHNLKDAFSLINIFVQQIIFKIKPKASLASVYLHQLGSQLTYNRKLRFFLQKTHISLFRQDEGYAARDGGSESDFRVFFFTHFKLFQNKFDLFLYFKWKY